jgi:plastocyanin
MLSSRFAAVAALALVAGAPAIAQPAVQTINLASFSYAPSPIDLKAGRPVTLVFVNRAGGGHDFTAKQFFASSTITAGAAPGGQIELKGRQTKSVTLVPRAGTYSVHCGHFMHSAMGMKTTIVVD